MNSLRDVLTRCLRSTLGADSKSLSESRRTERKETLAQINSLSLEALDLSFNALCLGQTPLAYNSRSPFRGLESFRPEDAAYFFGREALTRKLVQKLNEHNFLAVLGASGSGKSSLVMAGLIPALNVPYAVFRPGAEPLAELDKALQAGPQLLVVDQFEELFTLSAREQRPEFISRLLEQSGRLPVVISLRADFLGEVASYRQLNDEVQKHLENIPPMDEAELRRAMEGQAGCAGLRFESDLSQQMLDDVSGEPGAMPLLQHALWTLWTRRHGRWLRAEEYRAFGGVKQAIASTAEAVFARCSDFEKERLRDIFLRLTRLDESADGRDTRRRVLLRDLIPADSKPAATTLLIKQLADARLVVVTGDEVEVAHEALIRHWERLRAWLNDDRDNLRLREGVSDDARRWENASRDESLLNHRGPRLELALVMIKNPRYRLNPVEQAYLVGCVEVRELEKMAAAKRRRYAIAGVSVTLFLIMAILVGWGWSSNIQKAEANAAKATAILEANIRATAQAEANVQKTEAEKQAKISRASELFVQATLMQDRNFQLSWLLGIEAYQTAAIFRTHNMLLNNIQTYNQINGILTGHISGVSSVAFSPDGKILASGSRDGTIILWDVVTRQPIGQPLVGETRTDVANTTITSIAFSSDGNILASSSLMGTIILWDVATHQPIGKPLTERTTYILGMVFSPDGKTIASEDSNRIILWNIVTRQPIRMLSLEPYEINSIVFSPDGKIIASGSGNGTIILWDVDTGQPLELSLIGQTSGIGIITFGPDGKILASGSEDGTIALWDITKKQLIGQLLT